MNKSVSILFSLLGWAAGVYWCVVLRNCESHYEVYGVVAILALLSWRQNKKAAPLPRRERLFALAFALFFSALVTLANGRLFDPYGHSLRPANRFFFLYAAVFFAGGVFLFREIFLFLARRALSPGRQPGHSREIRHIGLLCWAFLAAIYCLVFFSCYYPGLLTYDSENQLRQILGLDAMSNAHPIYHTYFIGLLFRLGMALTGSIDGAVAAYSLFSILVVSGCFSYSVSSIYRLTGRKAPAFAAAACYGLLPYHIHYSFTMWKDVFFSVSMMMLVIALFHVLKAPEDHPRRNGLVVFLAALTMCLTRNNGRLVLLGSLLLFLPLFWKSHRHLGVLLCAAALTSLAMTTPVLKLYQIPQPRVTELLSIPLQSAAKIITDECPLSEEDTALLGQILDLDAVPALYNPILSDPIKSATDSVPLVENPGAYLRLYLRLLRNYPLKCLEAWLDQTKGYWNGGYSYWVLPDAYQNGLGIRSTPHSDAAHSLFTAYAHWFERGPLLRLTVSIGANVWLVIGCLYVALIRRDRILAFLTVPILVTVATLLVGTPVFAEFRYVYCVFCTLPFLITAARYSAPSTFLKRS